MLKKICLNCGIEFEAERDRRKYCSLKCSAKNSVPLANKSNKRQQDKENNNNWKGGISKFHYVYKKRQVQKFPEKDRCRRRTYASIKKGELIRPDICSCCRAPGKTEAHHNDYNNHLDVVWLCKSCHVNLHNKLRK